jgi:hypothetical protein
MIVSKKIMVLMQAKHAVKELIPSGNDIMSRLIVSATPYSTMSLMEFMSAFIMRSLTLFG